MTKKQIAALVAALLTAVAGLLTQCPDDAAAPTGEPALTDAGAP